MYDGDALNLILSVDNKMADMWDPLAPHHNIFTLTEPKEISGNIPLPKPVTAIICNWLLDKDEPISKEKWEKFNQIPCIEE